MRELRTYLSEFKQPPVYTKGPWFLETGGQDCKWRLVVVVVVCCLVAEFCLTLCHPMDCSPPGSSIHGIFQVRILDWVTISFSGGGGLPDPRIEPMSLTLLGGFCTAEPPGNFIIKVKEKKI